MAGGRPQSASLTETCQAIPCLETLRLSPQEPSASSSSVCNLPPLANPGKYANTVTTKSSTANGGPLCKEQSASQETLQPILNTRDQEHGGQKTELSMLESPARSWKGYSQPGSREMSRARDVGFASSAGGSPSSSKKPPQQDSAYFSTKGEGDEGSEIDSKIQTRQMRARERIVILRGRVLRSRHRMKVYRNELRELRESVRDAVDKLTRKMNEMVVYDRMREDIAPYHESLRIAMDNLGPAEEAYDRLESRLEEGEEDLEEEEDHFYRHNDISAISAEISNFEEVISPLVKPYVPPETGDEDFSLENEMVQEYLARVAEAGRLKENLNELENEYYQLSGDAAFRKKHNIPLSAEATAILSDYPDFHADILESLHVVEDDLFDLRAKCLDEGLFGNNDHLYERRDALYEDVMDSIYEARDRSPIRAALHSIDHGEPHTNFADKREYVNNWLLEWVQESSVEALMLKAWIYFEYPRNPKNGKQLDDERWPELVLENWDKDVAGRSANANYNASRLDAIAGSTGRLGATSTGRSGILDSFHSLDGDLGDAEGKVEDIMGSETGSYTTQKVGDRTPRKRRPSSV